MIKTSLFHCQRILQLLSLRKNRRKRQFLILKSNFKTATGRVSLALYLHQGFSFQFIINSLHHAYYYLDEFISYLYYIFKKISYVLLPFLYLCLCILIKMIHLILFWSTMCVNGPIRVLYLWVSGLTRKLILSKGKGLSN